MFGSQTTCKGDWTMYTVCIRFTIAIKGLSVKAHGDSIKVQLNCFPVEVV